MKRVIQLKLQNELFLLFFVSLISSKPLQVLITAIVDTTATKISGKSKCKKSLYFVLLNLTPPPSLPTIFFCFYFPFPFYQVTCFLRSLQKGEQVYVMFCAKFYQSNFHAAESFLQGKKLREIKINFFKYYSQ